MPTATSSAARSGSTASPTRSSASSLQAPPTACRTELYMPLAFTPEQINHDFHWLLVLGRLKHGVTLAQANADMDAVTTHIAEPTRASNKGWSASVEPLQNNFLSKETIRGLWLLLGAVALRAADRVRQRGQPAARARHRAPARRSRCEPRSARRRDRCSASC